MNLTAVLTLVSGEFALNDGNSYTVFMSYINLFWCI